MKNCATGLSLRFFRVMIPTGLRVVGNSTGKRLSAGLPCCLRSAAAGAACPDARIRGAVRISSLVGRLGIRCAEIKEAVSVAVCKENRA